MAAPRETEGQISFPLDLGIDTVALEAAVQPFGPGAALVRSTNTRLTKTRGAPSKAPGHVAIENGSTSAGMPCGGIVPAANLDSSVAFFHPATANKRIAGQTAGSIGVTTSRGGTYWPAQVSRAGPLPCGQAAGSTPAICYDAVNRRTWIAVVRSSYFNGSGIFLSCLSDTGELLVKPTVVVTWGGTNQGLGQFVALTSHGAFGVRLWYRDVVDYASPQRTIRASTVSLLGLTVSLSPAVAIYTPIVAPAGDAIAVASDTDPYAYLVTHHNATSTTVAIHRVDVTTMTVTTITQAAACTTTSQFAAANWVSGGQNYLAVAVGDGTAGGKVALYDGDTMALRWGGWVSETAKADNIAVSFIQAGGPNRYVVSAFTDALGDIATIAPAGTTLYLRTVSSSGSTGAAQEYVLPWLRPMAQPQLLEVSATEAYPLFAMQRVYNFADDPLKEGFLFDPAIDVYRLDGTTGGVTGDPAFDLNATCVARLGVDTAYKPTSVSQRYGNAAYVAGQKYFLTYLEDSDYLSSTANPVRYAELDFDAGQPRYAHTPAGSALIAAALPAHWDGVEVTEICPLYRPTIHVAVSGGTAPPLEGGASTTVRWSCVHQWKDANGVLHRSAPAVVRTTAGSAQQPIIYVTRPVGVRDGTRGEPVMTSIYASANGGTLLYGQRLAIAYGSHTWYQYFDRIPSVPTPVIDATHPAIYTDGDPSQPLMAVHPPAARDIAVVGERAWLINAERPYEVWPSKRREFYVDSYVTYEWSSELVMQFPAMAGELMAVSEFNGFPLFLSDTGIWVVSGQGPDNSLGGQGFNPPEQLSDVPCTETRSVIQCPGGVLFRSYNRFAIFNGQARVFQGIDSTVIDKIVTAVLIHDESEVLFIAQNGAHHVYNYQLDRWTTWTTASVPACTCAALVPVTGDVLTYSAAVGEFRLVDPDTPSSSAQMAFATGHITLGGPQDDNVVHDIVIHGIAAGTHGLVVTLTPDYGQAPSVTRAFAAAEISAVTVNGQYTLSVSPGTMSMRAIKVSITETDAAGDGCRPLSVTILFAKNPGTKRDAVLAQGRK